MTNYTSYVTFESSAGPAALAQCRRCGAAILMSRESPTAIADHDKWHEEERAIRRALAEGTYTIGAVGGAAGDKGGSDAKPR